MNPTRTRSLLLAAAIVAALAACQRNDEPQATSNGQPTQIASPAHIQVGFTRDPSLPGAAEVFAAQDAAAKAKEDALVVQQAMAPQSEMVKSETPKEATLSEAPKEAAPSPAPERLSVAPENAKVN